MSEQRIAFRRIRGRIVPIRLTDKDLKGAAQITGSAALVGAAAVVSARLLRKSRKFFKNSAQIRGLGFNDPVTKEILGSKTRRVSKSRKIASRATIRGKIFSSRAKFIIGAASTVGAFLAASGVDKIADKRVSKEFQQTAETAIGIAIPLVGVAIFNKLSGIKSFRKTITGALRAGSGEFEVAKAFTAFASKGRRQTSFITKRFRQKAQQELFKSESGRASFVRRFLKKNL